MIAHLLLLSYSQKVPRLRDRPTGEILILLIAGTVCFGVLASGMMIGIMAIFRPETDITIWVARVTGLLNTMIGLLAGFLAGRTDYSQQRQVTPHEPPQ